MKLKRMSLILILFLLSFIVIACSDNSSTSENTSEGEVEAEPNKDATLRVAMQGVPPSLDPHITGSYMTMEMARPVFETLVTFDSSYEPQPMLADSWEISEDQKTYTFKLRQGVKFHNGEEMQASDVVASMNRWKEINATADRILGPGSFEVVDEYTVSLNLENPSFVALNILGAPAQFAGIMPEEVIAGTGADSVKEYIGTGPFKVTEYLSDQYLHLEKFADYQPRTEAPDGLAGKREALVANIEIDFVSDSTTRVSSLLTGEYNIGNSLPYDNYDQLDADPNVNVHIEEAGSDFIVFNKQQGAFSNQTMRQAVLAGLDMEALSIGTYSDERFFTLNHSLNIPDQVNWFNDAGKELYNQKDPEKAKQLLAEAGYNGEEVTIIASDIDSHRNMAIGLQQQLESLGIKTVLETYEFATILEYRNDPNNWDIFVVDLSTEPTSLTYLFFNPTWAGWTNDPEITNSLSGIMTAKNQEEATQYATDLQAAFYDYIPVIKPSNRNLFLASTSNLDGFDYFGGASIFWNVSLK